MTFGNEVSLFTARNKRVHGKVAKKVHSPRIVATTYHFNSMTMRKPWLASALSVGLQCSVSPQCKIFHYYKKWTASYSTWGHTKCPRSAFRAFLKVEHRVSYETKLEHSLQYVHSLTVADSLICSLLFKFILSQLKYLSGNIQTHTQAHTHKTHTVLTLKCDWSQKDVHQGKVNHMKIQ